MNVFVHADGSLSTPVCNLGQKIVRQALLPGLGIWIGHGELCENDFCTCHLNSNVVHKANLEEAEAFLCNIAIVGDN